MDKKPQRFQAEDSETTGAHSCLKKVFLDQVSGTYSKVWERIPGSGWVIVMPDVGHLITQDSRAASDSLQGIVSTASMTNHPSKAGGLLSPH